MFPKLPTNLPPHLNLKLIKTYLNSADLSCARQLFDKIPKPDLKSWTILITAYTKQGYPREALKLYTQLRDNNVKPDQLALLAVAKACATLSDLVKAKDIHEDVIKFGFGSDLLIGNAMIDMYGKCKYSEGARKVFNELTIKDVISWTSMCSCHLNCGLLREGILVFREMGLSGVRPNEMTLSSVLPAFAELKWLNSGREAHGYVVRNGMGGNVFVSSALVDVYASCSRLRDAELVFYNAPSRDVVSWNVMMSSYFLNGDCDKALEIFDGMRRDGIQLNYDSWNAVVGGCVQSGGMEHSLKLLGQMQYSGFKPNHITITSLLPACTHLESLKGGKEIHGYMFRHWFLEDVTSATALVYMYAKCGDLELAENVFSMMPRRDTIAWNTMIVAYSMHGKGVQALTLFNKMVGSGVKPNSVTFTGILSGCSHSRLVDDGLWIFNSMSADYKIEPDTEHYSSMIDILSRAGRLEEAYRFILQMPIEPGPSAWGALLGGCRIYKNVDLGRIAANQLFKIEPDNPGNYVLFSNILVGARLWEEASEARKLMRDRGLRKVPGCSWVLVKNKMYTFVVGDKSNVQRDEIYKFLKEMGEKMKFEGYLPDTDFVLQDLDKEDKEDSLCNHSEKLAVAFGILNLKGESCVRVFKNLRICGDCHVAIKFIAKTVGVQIIVRDSLRFHHFKDGLCSCGDFW